MLLRVLLALLAWLSLSANAGAVEIGAPAPGINRPLLSGTASVDLQQLRGKVVMVDFWASWCGPCQMMAPAYEQAAQMLEPHVRLAKVNTEEEQTLAARFGISSIPTLVLLRGGRELARQPGAMGVQDIVRWVRSKI